MAHKKVAPTSCVLNSNFSSPGFCNDPLFFKNMFNYISDELVIFDDQGRFVCVNDAAVEGLGYSREYILKKTVVDFLSEKMSIQQWKKKHFDELKRRRTPISYRIDRVIKGKEVQIVDITAVYFPHDGKDFILSFGRDVTRQVYMQRALQESRNLYHFLTEGAGDGIAALDVQGRLVYANKTLQDIVGLESGEYRGRKFISFVSRHARAKVNEIFEKALSGEQQVHGTIEALSSAGEAVPVEISMTPLVKAGQVVSVHMIIRDLRPRKNMEQMERQEEKMDALRYFVSGTAQELKNPLMGLVKRTEALLQKYAQRDFEYVSYREFKEIVSTIEAVRDQISYCYQTVQRLTMMGQKKAGIKKGHCYVNQSIKSVVKDKEVYMRQCDIQAKVLFANRDVEIRMTSVDLIQILNNLIDNAIQAMPSGGQLTIKAFLAPRGGDVIIEVKDQGVGIPKEQMDHIFEPFFTTKFRGVQKNSGLGLPIVHSLIRAVQGEMRISSSLRSGTIVRLFLPIYRLKRKKA